MTGHLTWYVARAGGLLAWSLATASVALGLVMSSKLVRRRPTTAWQLDLHRFLGALAVVFTGVHVAGLLLDTYVHFGVVDVLVPFASAWHPVAVAGGVVALYLLLTVELTSLVRQRLPRRVWHSIHLASFGVFLLGTIHALTAGTDTRGGAAAWVVLTSCTLLGVLGAMRLLGPDLKPARHVLPSRRAAPRRIPRREVTVGRN